MQRQLERAAVGILRKLIEKACTSLSNLKVGINWYGIYTNSDILL